VRVAGRAAYAPLLEAGARIFEYQATMLHAKTMVVDGVWCSVGSVNFDNRSFQLHDEATLSIWTERFAALLTESFEEDLVRSEEIEAGRFARRSLSQRTRELGTTLVRREL
jgi:cardiolipin synthase